ncbi:TerC family protein [uncultured Tenacibaculum sp.]|uniref:TerC family protein n=1 Tax=uncultured Tenacibaculum sp. TaxID=174713 RepID=UPI00262772F4|nr:TerC family protein [uncultured Tenacibaculum sp.]
MEIFLQPDTWGALVTLTFLEIVLGIDNIIFISIAANKLPEDQQKKATNIGLVLAMLLRIVLLFGISLLIAMNSPLFHIDLSWFKAGVTGQALILFAGGIFLLYKSTKEIHHKVEGMEEGEEDGKPQKGYTLSQAIIQITLINIVFSFDSILTAVGMTNGVEGAMIIMVASVVLSMIIMMLFANPVGKFVNKHPTIQMLGLSFLILIGFMLIAEGAHLSHAKLFGEEVGTIPKGYLYFAITFSLVVEMLNMKMRGNSSKKD